MKKYFIGADVSKKTLDCVLYDDNSLKMKESHIKITNDREGRDGLVKWMKGLGVTVKDAIVCMEYTGIYSYSFAELLAKKKIDFTMIPPLKIKGANRTNRTNFTKIFFSNIFSMLQRDCRTLAW